MSNGLNNLIDKNTLTFLEGHAVTTALLGVSDHRPRLGVSNYDFVRSENHPTDQGVILLPFNDSLTDSAISAYWLPQGSYIDVPITAPPAEFIFTPEFSGCKVYVDKVGGNYRIFHIQCPHEAVEYPENLRGERTATVDSRDYGGVPSVDGPAYPSRISETRCTVLLRFVKTENCWSIFLQGLTGIGPGVSDGRLVYPPGPVQSVNGVTFKHVPIPAIAP